MRNITISTQSDSDLTTTAKVKSYLEITDTSYDDEFDKIVSRASKFIQSQTHRQLVETTYEETIDGEGVKELYLSEYPVISVSSIVVDDTTVYDGSSQDGNDYYIYNDSGLIIRDIAWEEDYQNIVVTYDAGYATIPGDLEQACIELVAFKYHNKDYIGLKSHNLGGESVTFDMKNIPSEIADTIYSYKKVNI